MISQMLESISYFLLVLAKKENKKLENKTMTFETDGNLKNVSIFNMVEDEKFNIMKSYANDKLSYTGSMKPACSKRKQENYLDHIEINIRADKHKLEIDGLSVKSKEQLHSKLRVRVQAEVKEELTIVY